MVAANRDEFAIGRQRPEPAGLRCVEHLVERESLLGEPLEELDSTAIAVVGRVVQTGRLEVLDRWHDPSVRQLPCPRDERDRHHDHRE